MLTNVDRPLNNGFLSPCWSALSLFVLAVRDQLPGSRGLRLFYCVIVTIAVVSTTACETMTSYGVSRVGSTGDSLIAVTYASGPADDSSYYESADGGLTWTRPAQVSWESIEWGEETANTSYGIYRVYDSSIVFTPNHGRTETVYSSVFLKEPVNAWVQMQETRHLGHRQIATSLGPPIFSRTAAMTHDPHSGNVVVVMGLQGVLVGSPTGRWTPIAVGRYSPTDFSLLARVGTLFSAWDFWIVALSFPMAMACLSMLTAHFWNKKRTGVSGCCGFLTIVVTIFLVVLPAGTLLFNLGSSMPNPDAEFLKNVFAVLVFVVLIVSALTTWKRGWDHLGHIILGVLIGMVSFVTLTFLLWMLVGGLPIIFQLVAFVLCATTAYALTGKLINAETQALSSAS